MISSVKLISSQARIVLNYTVSRLLRQNQEFVHFTWRGKINRSTGIQQHWLFFTFRGGNDASIEDETRPIQASHTSFSTTTDIDRLNSSIPLQRIASDKPFVYSKDAGTFHRTCNFKKNSFYFQHESVAINQNVPEIRKIGYL